MVKFKVFVFGKMITEWQKVYYLIHETLRELGRSVPGPVHMQNKVTWSS